MLQMINHHAILRQELKKIGNVINKKYGVLRKEIIKTSEVFDNQQIPVFPYQVCFGLFRQISETGSLSSSIAFFPFLQSIINLGFSNNDMSRQILTLLIHTKSIPKFLTFENESKMQQILAILVSKNCIDLKNLSFTQSLFNIVLSLENTKYRSLWIKSSTILYQTVQLLINQIRESPIEEKELSLTRFLNDLIKIAGGQQPSWLIQYGDPYLIFYILLQILEDKYFLEFSQEKYKKTFADLLTVVRKQLRKCIQTAHSFLSASKIQIGSSNSIRQNWQLSVQNKVLILMRTGVKINVLIKEGFEILQQIIKIISDKRPSNYKAIAYESINFLFRNSQWIFNLFQSQFADLFNFFLTTQFNTVKFLLTEQKEKIDLVSNMIGQETHYNKIMGSNNIEISISQCNFSIEVKLIVKNLQQITYTLYALYSQRFKIDMNQKIQGKPPLQKTYKFCQKTVFETIKTILSREMSEDTLQSLLKISQKFINISGCFNDSSVSAIYLKLMCKYCLPSQFKNIDHRHIQMNKMILNTANCLGHLLTSNCWVIVWKTLENYSLYYNRYLLGKQQLQSARQSDVQILYKSMDSIFTQSSKYNDKYLLQIIRSLVEVAYQCLQNNYSDETRKIFAFERIQQIYKLNLFRINLIWPQLSSSLLCITTSKVLYFRLSALGLLNNLIPISLNYLKNHKQALKLPFDSQNYQQLLLEPWINLVNCQFQQIKDQFVLAVNKLIIDYGHIMKNGWKCIIQIVKKTNDLKSIQAIVETFLQKVHNNITDVVVIVDSIQRRLQDTNQKYLCLTMIWAVADYACKNNLHQILNKIYYILLVPEQMFNLGTQARHSSFYIFAEILVHNCSQKSAEFWESIFQQITKFCKYGIGQCMNAKNKTFGEQALKNLITNLIKIYKKFFLVSKEWHEQNREIFEKELKIFYEFCSSVLQFHTPQIYQYIIKQCKQILYPKIKDSIRLKQFYSFLENLTQIYLVQNDSKILKCLITYLPPDIYEILGMILEGIDQESSFNIIYRLMQKNFLLRLQAHEKDIKLNQLRIFFQEKHHYQFMKKMQSYIAEEKPELVQFYILNLTKTIHKLKLYEDYQSIGKTLPFLTNLHIKFCSIQAALILQTVKQVIKIRVDESWIKNSSSMKDVPIWYMGVQDLMKIGFEYIQQKLQYRENLYNILMQLLTEDNSNKVNKYPKQMTTYYYQNELEICHFLLENYFFSNEEFKNIEARGQNDINKIAIIIQRRSQQIQAEDTTKKGYNALQFIFKASFSRPEQSYIDKKIVQNQSILIGKLFQRIVLTFDKLKFGPGITQSKYVIEEIKFVLKQMLNLKLREGILVQVEQILTKVYVNSIKINSIVLALPESHLFFFQPLITKCIRSDDQQLLQLIQTILQKTSNILLNLVKE